MADHAIDINETNFTKQGRKRYFVDPPKLNTGSTVDDTVTWTNNTSGPVTLFLPAFDLAFRTTDTPPVVPALTKVLTSTGTGKSYSLQLKSGFANGRYPYSVYCAGSSAAGSVPDIAEGQSPPAIDVP